MRWVRFALSCLLTLALLWATLTTFAPLPLSVGQLLDPFAGMWVNVGMADATLPDTLRLPELEAPVQVVVDERGVPHVFAQNDHDLYLTQGYLAAHDRLWQMDFQIRAAAGELAAILGPGPDSALIRYDRLRRRRGIRYGAERRLTQMMGHDTTRHILEAYAAGVNAYLATLSPAEYPIEYKLLGYTPEPWSPLKSAIFAMYIADDLSGGSDDLPRTLALSEFGPLITERLYPDYPYQQAPMLPPDTRWPRPSRLPIPPTLAPEQPYAPDSLLRPGTPTMREKAIQGSNGWAVAGSRSDSGHPLLANDMHLGLNLPAIWYEMQLQAPGVNVYGVCFPGAPGVVVGFNDSIAWGATSGADDVLDYYSVTFRNERRREYYHNGQWLQVTRRVDTIRVKGQAPVLDTILYTHQGPVLYDGPDNPYPQPIAMQWMAHEPSDVLLTYYLLDRANNYLDYEQAIRHHHSPAINFPFAATNGDIAIWHAGRLPNRWPGQGKYLLDGSRRDHSWAGDIPWEQLPHLYNPEQGFVHTANQHPTAPDYPYEYRGAFEDYRGRSLYRLLGGSDTFDLADMQAMQLDSYGQFAADALPLMLAALDSNALSTTGRVMYDSLRAWNYHYEREQVGPTLYETWWQALVRSIWMDEFEATGTELVYPDKSTTIGLLRDSVVFSFYRRPGDTLPPTREVLIRAAFAKMEAELGNDPAAWVWGTRHQLSIRHLTRVLTPFSRDSLTADGRGGTLNAITRYGGPSWRMVVEMSSPPQAYGIYPGGQSGRPGAAGYDAFIGDWLAGEYYPLWLMQSPQEEGQPVRQRSVLRP